MRKPVALLLAPAAVLGALLSAGLPEAGAVPPFYKEFEAMYVKADPTTEAEISLAEAVKEAKKCNVCHVGTDKKKRNAYGEALSELLDKKADLKNVEKIQAALKQVADLPSVADDPDAPTFGDLISAGQLPAGQEEAN